MPINSEMQWLRALLIKLDEVEAIMDEIDENQHAYSLLERLKAEYRPSLREIEKEMLREFASGLA